MLDLVTLPGLDGAPVGAPVDVRRKHPFDDDAGTGDEPLRESGEVQAGLEVRLDAHATARATGKGRVTSSVRDTWSLSWWASPASSSTSPTSSAVSA